MISFSLGPLHISLSARSAKEDFRSALWTCKFLALKRNNLTTLLEFVIVNLQVVAISEYVFNVADPANNRFSWLKSPNRLAIGLPEVGSCSQHQISWFSHHTKGCFDIMCA